MTYVSRNTNDSRSVGASLPNGDIDVVITGDVWWDQWNHTDLLDAWPLVIENYPKGLTEAQMLRLSFKLPSRIALALLQYHLLRKETRGE